MIKLPFVILVAVFLPNAMAAVDALRSGNARVTPKRQRVKRFIEDKLGGECVMRISDSSPGFQNGFIPEMQGATMLEKVQQASNFIQRCGTETFGTLLGGNPTVLHAIKIAGLVVHNSRFRTDTVKLGIDTSDLEAQKAKVYFQGGPCDCFSGYIELVSFLRSFSVALLKKY